MTPAGQNSGFTLLELLVAMAIFAIVGALALGRLNAVLGQQEIARRQLDHLIYARLFHASTLPSWEPGRYMEGRSKV